MCANRHERPKPESPKAAGAQNCCRTIQLTCVEVTALTPDFTARLETALLATRIRLTSQKKPKRAMFPGKRGGRSWVKP